MSDSAGVGDPKLRRAVCEEAQLLTDLAIRSKAYWGYDDRFMAACRAELTVSPQAIREHATFVIETDRIVGFYMLRPVDAQETELELLFVEPGEIGRGQGKRLIEHAKATARAAGYRSIVVQGDPHADGFYRAQGAERIGSRPSDSIEGRLLPVYRIPLHPTDGAPSHCEKGLVDDPDRGT